MNIGLSEAGMILKSSDGVVWTQGAQAEVPLYSVTHGDGRFVAVGFGGTIMVSQNGETWIIRNQAPRVPFMLSRTATGSL